jgi:hypothetical protein
MMFHAKQAAQGIKVMLVFAAGWIERYFGQDLATNG